MNRTNDIVELSQQLIRFPTVTVGESIRFDVVKEAADFIVGWLKAGGVEVRRFDKGDYPAILAGFPGQMNVPVMLSGHYDVVAPEPDDGQFVPRIEGDYLWGRGSADMKTVVATYMVWLRDKVAAGPPYPRMNLLLVGNEETGELEPMGSGHVLGQLATEGYQPDIFIAGERTEEQGTDLWGLVCTQNRGITRFQVSSRGVRGHSGMTPQAADLTQKLIRTRAFLTAISEKYLTLSEKSAWYSQIRFPFVQVGLPGVYNITPDYGVLGVEIRAIPSDPLDKFMEEFEAFAVENDLEISDKVDEPGSACMNSNPYLEKLVNAIEIASGNEVVIGNKMAGTSARFAPNGDGVVWGQSGIGPHSSEERHYIPSIDPYYQALDQFGKLTLD
jgi:succinyl-diaminopimelate desuccinylase